MWHKSHNLAWDKHFYIAFIIVNANKATPWTLLTHMPIDIAVDFMPRHPAISILRWSAVCVLFYGVGSTRQSRTPALHTSLLLHQIDHINWYHSLHVPTTPFWAFPTPWCQESPSLWQIWYRMWHAVHVQTIWTADCEVLPSSTHIFWSSEAKGVSSRSLVPQIQMIMEQLLRLSHCRSET